MTYGDGASDVMNNWAQALHEHGLPFLDFEVAAEIMKAAVDADRSGYKLIHPLKGALAKVEWP